jgi:hypothetical protein
MGLDVVSRIGPDLAVHICEAPICAQIEDFAYEKISEREDRQYKVEN